MTNGEDSIEELIDDPAATVAWAYGFWEKENHLKYFQRKCPEVLDDYYIWDSKCTNAEDRKEEILITHKRILFTPIIKSWGMTAMVRPVEVPFEDIKHLELSLHDHTNTQNFGSTNQRWIALNFVTIDHRSFRKLLYVGSTEAEINNTQPLRVEHVKEIKCFNIKVVENTSSSSDSTVRFGVGVIGPFD